MKNNNGTHYGGTALSGQDLAIDFVDAVARGQQRVTVTSDTKVLDRVRAAHLLVQEAVNRGDRIYGVTTGYGSEAEVVIQPALAAASQSNLLTFLNTGAGKPVDPRHVRAAMLLRANMLLRGVSGVRLQIVERLVKFLNSGAVPVVGELGSIGASGDLVPMAGIARAITGHAMGCRVRLDDRVLESREVLRELGLEPLELLPKEGLAIVNGTSFSAAIAANCTRAAQNQLGLALAANAMMIRALCGHEEPFLPFVHDCKPHPGQRATARVMRALLKNGNVAQTHVQDRYSIRCLPQYYGSIVEGIERIAGTVETEMNAVTDNPMIDLDHRRFYQSGNFLGQYLGIAMDDLRRFLGLIAKQLDVQIALLVAPEFSRGLPASLRGNGGRPINMGLKGLQITGNSIMPLLVHLGNPLVDHYPTHAEQFNQNVNGLSWGAANLTAQSVELHSYYLAVALLFSVQAVDLRANACSGHYDGRCLLSSTSTRVYEEVLKILDCPPGEARPLLFDDEDRSLEHDIALLSSAIREGGDLVKAAGQIFKMLADEDKAREPVTHS